MKRLLVLLSLVVTVSVARATNYYVSAAGNDANAGTTPATAWRTLSKVNSFTFAANDSILLRRGDVFVGSIIVNRNNLIFSAYGTGARPVISGFATLSSWTLASAGIYQCPVSAKNYLNLVAMNGRPVAMGRYPNATDANGGYLFFEGATSSSITDNEMTSAVNWTGAEIAIRKNGWSIDRCIITGHSGGTFTYRIGRGINAGVTPQLNSAKLNHGYFILDDVRTLDQLGEWYYDTTAKVLKMFFGTNTPSNYSVKVAVVDTLINMNNKTYITVDNINFEGANMSGIYSYLGGYITVRNCDFTNMGAKGVHVFGSNDTQVDNVRVFNALSNGIQVTNRTKSNIVIKNCLVRNTGPIAGQGSFFDDSDYKGIYVASLNNVLIESNVVDTVGLSGIQFNGSDVVVQKNYVNYFCYQLHDNGGIYTYAGGTDANPGTIFTNRTVQNNVIMNGVGAPNGSNSANEFCAGIYLDGRTMNVNVLNNTVFNSAKNGIHCNNPSNINIRGNTFFNNLNDISFMRWAWGSITNLNIKQNVSFPLDNTQRNIYYTNAGLNSPTPTTLQNNLLTLGSIDSNYYNTYSDASIQFEIYDTAGGPLIQTSPQSLDAWRTLASYDLKTKRPARQYQPYTINSIVGTNVFTNSAFTSNITGVTLFGTSTTAAWDNTSKITGTGSLRMDFSAPVANRYSFIHTPIGAVSSSKKYILRFKTLGTTQKGIVRAYIRKTASPYNNLVPTQTKSFGTSVKVQEFLFDGPTADAGGSFVIEIEQNSGTTYIDDIEFYEVNATVNTIASQVRFEYNETAIAKTVTLDAKYIGVDSTVYNGVITLQPYSGKVMVKAGPIDSLPIANAGADKIVYLPADSVMLNGTATGSVISSYAWTKVSGPVQFTINSPSNATTKVSSLVVGTYKFELRVTDNRGFISRDTLSVIVANILPVKLESFSGTARGSKVSLNWLTSSEINSSHYVIERSADGRSFTAIGTVTANNVADRQNSYSMLDNTPASGINYYRLVMVDRDGTKTYSRIVSVNMTGVKSFSVDNAVMTEGGMKLTINSNKAQLLNMVTVDVAGRVVMKTQLQLQPGANVIDQPVRSISKNVYYINLSAGSESVVKTIISE